jgi:hypothetical protein
LDVRLLCLCIQVHSLRFAAKGRVREVLLAMGLWEMPADPVRGAELE